MKVIKKDGRMQDFIKDKLALSIKNSARDVGVLLSEKESLLLSEDVRKKVIFLRGDDGVTSSYEIRAIMTDIMVNSGYSNLAKHYNEMINM